MAAKSHRKSMSVEFLEVVGKLTILPDAILEILGTLVGFFFAVQVYFVDPRRADNSGSGKSWGKAFKTMTYALSVAATGSYIFFRGDVREECIGSNLKFDITIIGCGSLHHPDLPAAGYDPGASCWRPPAAPTAATPLLEVRGRGWRFINFMVDAPVDAAAFLLKRNALEGTAEYDASHASFIGVRGVDGKHFVEDSGGCYNVTIDACELKAFTDAAIKNSSTAVANPLNWKIINNFFPPDVSDFGNVTHIDSPFNCAIIKDNIFGTVRSTALYVDLTGGNGNVVADNILGGVYDTSDYVAGTGDLWYGNRVAVKAVTAPDGVSLTVPAAP